MSISPDSRSAQLGIRALACAAVIFYHIKGAASSYGYSLHWLESVASFGANGTDYFRVLSGYVAYISLQSDKQVSAKDYWVRRCSRVVPLYWFMTLTLFSVFLVFPSYFRTSSHSWFDLFCSLSFASGLLEQKLPILFVGWTLEYEMAFYVLVAFGIKVFGSSSAWRLPFLVFPFGVFVFGLDSLLLEFCFGILCAIAHRFIGRSRVISVGLFSVGFVVAVFTSFDPVIWGRLIAWGVPAACFMLSVSMWTWNPPNFLQVIGRASFSSYLVQVFSIPLFFKALVILGFGGTGDVAAFLCVMFSLACGLFVHRVIELRLNRHGESLVRKLSFTRLASQVIVRKG